MAAKNEQVGMNSDRTQTSNKAQKFFKLTPVRRAVLMACGASLAVGGAPIVMAQEVAALDEIIVTARKRSENLQDVPVSVLAFGAEAIEKQGIKGLEDYARLIPSLTYSSWLPSSSIVVFRGVTVTADAFSGSSSAATFFNEMPITSQGQNPAVATVDMERIEAVSGPQPTTYGSSAQSGVLDLSLRSRIFPNLAASWKSRALSWKRAIPVTIYKLQ